jgi:hypothetical protein
VPIVLPYLYYRFKKDSTEAYPCPHPLNCVGLPRNGTGQQLCLKGAIGPLCMICQPGYYLRESTSQCEECDTVTEHNYYLGPAIILTLVLMMVVVAWCVKDRAIAWKKVPANAWILGERLLHEPYDYTVYGTL